MKETGGANKGGDRRGKGYCTCYTNGVKGVIEVMKQVQGRVAEGDEIAKRVKEAFGTIVRNMTDSCSYGGGMQCSRGSKW